MSFVIVAAYLVFMIAIGLLSNRHHRNTPDDYFLAGRKTRPWVLFFTLIATNFSAFFFLGFAGAGYRIGYSYYGIMAFGTALVAVAFFFIGIPARRLGRAHGYITPPELIGDRTGSRPLKLAYLAVMVFFTIPYLALQPIGAGYLLAELTNGAVPYFAGAILLTVCMVFYVFLGGMRSVAATDVAQGAFMFGLIILAVVAVGRALGGVGVANDTAFRLEPALFSRSGLGGFFTPKIWFSLMVLWILAVPMFPQVFMRFFIARSDRALAGSAVCYPLVTAVLFFGPVMIGVWGHLEFPGLVGTESDQILPMMLGRLTPDWLAALIMVGALSAFMSTMDSQLLALSAMLTRDLFADYAQHRAGLDRQVVVGRWLVVGLSVVGLLIALRPPDTIFAIATQAFTGLAVLFPTTVAVLHWRRVTPGACLASIVVGQLLLVGFHYRWLPPEAAFGFQPVVPVVGTTLAVLVVVSLMRPAAAPLPARPASTAS